MEMLSLGRRKVVFLSSLLLFFCFVFLYSQHIFTSPEVINLDNKISGHCNNACQIYHRRLDAYCHRTLLNLSMQQHLAHEGRLVSKDSSLSDEFKLVHAHVMIRHGDRTPVHTFKIGSTIFYECGLIDSSLRWDGLSDFPDIEPLPPSTQLQSGHLKLHPGVNTRRCGVGMLTQMGFKQHRSLGTLLKTKYKTLLNDHFSATDVYAQSTDMPRTIQSAAAFLLGFLPNSTSVRRATKIHVSPGTSNHKPPPGVDRVYPSCQGFFDFLDEDLKKSGYYTTEKRVFHPLLAKLCQMFSIPYPNQPIMARLFDHFMTRGCHKRDDPLPCFRGDCVDFDYALKLFDFNDWNWSHKLPKDSSLLRVLPFLTHSVLEPMLKVIAMEKEASNDDNVRDPYSFKFMLTLSHDDTIMMLLNALGYRIDHWIPYASRVVFELWKKKASPDNGYYVRVLFNGETISRRTFSGRKGAPSALLDGELIPFDNWRDFLTTGKYRNLAVYNEACRN